MEKYAVLTLALIIISYVYLKLAAKYNIIDKPNQRSSHTNPTVRGGGIIFPISILLFFVFNDFKYPYFTLGVFLISVISFLDDIYTLSPKLRFPFQILTVVLVLLESSLPIEFIWLFYLLMGVGIINSYNFMDGINGITGLYSLSVLLGFYLINSNENIINNDLIYFTAISLVIFGYYNFRKKALFFAGDIGSVTMGVLVFFMGLLFTITLSSPLILLIIIVYGADTTLTFIYRKLYTEENIFDAHRHHIYQKLVHVKQLPHLKVSILYTLLQLVINLVVFYTYSLSLTIQIIIFSCVIVFFTVLYVLIFKYLKKLEYVN